MMDIMYKHKKLDAILQGKIINAVYEGNAENSICIAFNDGTFMDFKLAPNCKIKLQTEVKVKEES